MNQSIGRSVGVIKSFNPEKKFGFIECAETFNQFGRDVFLSDQQIGNYGIGAPASFSVSMNSQGFPQAMDLQDPPEGWNPEMNSGNWSANNAGMSSIGGGGGQGDQEHLASLIRSLDDREFVRGPDGRPQRFVGTIKKFDITRKFGFIECNDI